MNERAVLWGIYFSIRALDHPPAYLRVAQEELERELDVDRGAPTGAVRRLHVAGSGKPSEQLPEVAKFKALQETALRTVVETATAVDAIERFVGDPERQVISLEDLQRYSRAAVAAIDGVGPHTMEALDAAFLDRGLSWAGAV